MACWFLWIGLGAMLFKAFDTIRKAHHKEYRVAACRLAIHRSVGSSRPAHGPRIYGRGRVRTCSAPAPPDGGLHDHLAHINHDRPVVPPRPRPIKRGTSVRLGSTGLLGGGPGCRDGRCDGHTDAFPFHQPVHRRLESLPSLRSFLPLSAVFIPHKGFFLTFSGLFFIAGFSLLLLGGPFGYLPWPGHSSVRVPRGFPSCRGWRPPTGC